MKFSCSDEHGEEASYTILSSFVMFETFRNKKENKESQARPEI